MWLENGVENSPGLETGLDFIKFYNYFKDLFAIS